MSDWTAGYVADIGYTFGYYHELNPLRIKLAFLNQGLVAPEVGVACELGFGQGLSTNIHAAASVVQWHGTDFNPSQASYAQELATASNSAAQLRDDAFSEFCARADLPDFDFISLHGIWSWISDENRSVIVDFIRRKLKVGGVLYISYNTLPGWATFAPMRHLLTEHAEVLGAEGRGIISRINGAIEFADKLLETNPAYVRANPGITDRMKKMKELNRHYLAHEYFNRDWYPMHFATLGQWLEPAKVEYACSASFLDHIENINLSPEQQTFLNEIPDAMFRQTVRDFMINQQFRRDYWVKGARKMNTIEQTESLRDVRVILTTPRADVSLKITGALGEATMSEAIYNPVLDTLADNKTHTIAQLELSLKDKGINFRQIVEAVLLLVGGNHVLPVQDEQFVSKAKKTCERLNQHLLLKARGSNDTTYLASPLTGGGIIVNRFQQLFLLSRANGFKQPAEWAQHVYQGLAAQGQKLIKEGKPLESMEENLAELNSQAQSFAEKQLPLLKALNIV